MYKRMIHLQLLLLVLISSLCGLVLPAAAHDGANPATYSSRMQASGEKKNIPMRMWHALKRAGGSAWRGIKRHKGAIISSAVTALVVALLMRARHVEREKFHKGLLERQRATIKDQNGVIERYQAQGRTPVKSLAEWRAENCRITELEDNLAMAKRQLQSARESAHASAGLVPPLVLPKDFPEVSPRSPSEVDMSESIAGHSQPPGGSPSSDLSDNNEGDSGSDSMSTALDIILNGGSLRDAMAAT